jgi:hypothetical protein
MGVGNWKKNIYVLYVVRNMIDDIHVIGVEGKQRKICKGCITVIKGLIYIKVLLHSKLKSKLRYAGYLLLCDQQ